MGKSQRKRKTRRHNPIRVPDSHLPKGLASAEATSNKKDSVIPIIQKMDSADASERKWACVTVANIIHNDPSTRRLLQGKDVIAALIKRLSDNEEEVVREAMGALRNIAIDGGYDICAEMFNKQILEPMTAFVIKISRALEQYLVEPPNTQPDDTRKGLFEFTDNVITILWCLSETSNKALNAINEMQLVPLLLSILHARQRLPTAAVNAAAHCLYVLTDENKPVVVDIRSNASHLAVLLEIVRESTPIAVGSSPFSALDTTSTLRVLISGTLRNISPLPLALAASMDELDDQVILPVLRNVISAVNLSDLSNSALELLQRRPEYQIRNLSLSSDQILSSDHKSEVDVALERCESDLLTLRYALEILAGICASLREYEDVHISDEEDDLSTEMETAPEGFDAVMIDENFSTETTLEPSREDKRMALPSTQSMIASLSLLIRPTPLSFPPVDKPSAHPPITSVLGFVHIAALDCLNNIFMSLGKSGQRACRELWETVWEGLAIAGTTFGLGHDPRRDYWDVAVGVLWVVGNVWKGFLVPKLEHIRVLIQLCSSTTDDRLRVKTVGALECLAHFPNDVEANEMISDYIISLLPSDSAASCVGTEPLLQAVSALIDIYSDENTPYDTNFRKNGYLTRLSRCQLPLKKAVKAIDRRQEGGAILRQQGDAVCENLRDFIQYRRKLNF